MILMPWNSRNVSSLIPQVFHESLINRQSWLMAGSIVTFAPDFVNLPYSRVG